MNDRFEEELRKALRPVDPGTNFAERVLAKLPQKATVPLSGTRRAWRWIPAAIAASLVAAVLIRHEWQLRRELEQGRIAREQLMEALRVTSEKLDVAYRAAQGRPAIEIKEDAEPKSDETTI
jgi:hypothetical protein